MSQLSFRKYLALAVLATAALGFAGMFPFEDPGAGSSQTAGQIFLPLLARNPGNTGPAQATPTVPPDRPILEPGGPRAATDLRAVAECEQPGVPVAEITWTVAEERGEAQRVDVTIYNFEEGQFDSSEILPPGQSTLRWYDLNGQAIHFWRVLTLHPEGWVPSDLGGFAGPTCVGRPPGTPTPTLPPIP